MCRVGAYRPFSLGHEDIKEMAGIEVSSKEIERVWVAFLDQYFLERVKSLILIFFKKHLVR